MINLAIVEDNASIRDSLFQYLSMDKINFSNIYTYNSVEDLLAIPVNSIAIDIVLLDINLPGMSGIKGIAYIKEKYSKAEIMMVSVMEDSESVFNSLCAGAAGFITKDTALEKIKESIITLFKGGSPITPHIARKVVEFFNPKKKFKDDLTPRERDIVQGIVDGLSYKMIADRLNISHDTVRKHILSTYRKLQINSKGELIAKFHRGDHK